MSNNSDRVRTNEKMDDVVVLDGGGLVYNPFNPLNVEITLSDVQHILVSYGLPPIVYNLNLYKRAFIHRSYVKRTHEVIDGQQPVLPCVCPSNCVPLKSKSNDRLEFIGDGILEQIVKNYIYNRFPDKHEGFMTEKKIEIVKNVTIGRIAYEMGLHKWLILSNHAEDMKTRTNFKKIGCLFEAFLGAMFTDFNKISVTLNVPSPNEFAIELEAGFQMTRRFLINVLEKHINWVDLVKSNNNFKNILQMKIQKEFKTTPHYIELEHTGEGFRMGAFLFIGKNVHTMSPNDAMFISDLPEPTFAAMHAVRNMNKEKGIFILLSEGVHKIKQDAEQIACQIALDVLR